MTGLGDSFRAINSDSGATVTFTRISEERFLAVWYDDGCTVQKEYEEWLVKDFLVTGYLFMLARCW